MVGQSLPGTRGNAGWRLGRQCYGIQISGPETNYTYHRLTLEKHPNTSWSRSKAENERSNMVHVECIVSRLACLTGSPIRRPITRFSPSIVQQQNSAAQVAMVSSFRIQSTMRIDTRRWPGRHGHLRRTLRRCFSSTTRLEGETEDFLTNDGVIEGVWIFCRHGDRTPGRALSPAHRRDEEAAFWVSKLPYPDSAFAFEAYSKYFPLDILPGTNQGNFIDVKRNPFGFLTQTGLAQLKENGHRFFNRYNHHGHHLPDQLEWRWEVSQDFLSAWDVKVYSTNYLRTVMSVQSFLDGLLGTNCYMPSRTRGYDPKVVKEDRIPDHSWAKPDEQKNALVSVCVRDLSNDPLNAFDRNPDLIAELVSEVMLSEDFLKRDAAAAPLAARLANVLPGLVRPFRSDFSSRSPSGINWVEAADHFVCRGAHKLDYARFSDFEHEERVGQTLAAMAHQTLAHLAWRFRKWYQNKRLLALIAAPPLREIAGQMNVTPKLDAGEKRPFVIYSCHDITILGLLYGLGADFLEDDQSGKWRFWPVYGSHLVFELVRVKEGPSSSDTHVVRVLFNGKPVISVGEAPAKGSHAKAVHLGGGPDQMLFVEDFLQVVKTLEDTGGHDYDSLLGRV